MATGFMRGAHGQQLRKYTNELYSTHPTEVALIISEVYPTQNSDTLRAAALLHDVLEDCPHVTEAILRYYFPNTVVDLVVELTDEYTKAAFPDLNRRERKHLELNRIANISANAQTVKVADCISNARSITQHDRVFSKVYMREMKLLSEVLTKAEPELLDQLLIILSNYEAKTLIAYFDP